jgi:hypothetical protein
MNDRHETDEMDPRRRSGWLKSRLGTVIVRCKKTGEDSAQCEQPDNEPTKDRNAIGSPLIETIS